VGEGFTVFYVQGFTVFYVKGFTVFYSNGVAGCAKLNADAGVSTRRESV
jgi:hypothetical protein